MLFNLIQPMLLHWHHCLHCVTGQDLVTLGELKLPSVLMLFGMISTIETEGYAPACCLGFLPQIHIHQWIKCNGRLCIGTSCSAISVAGMETLWLKHGKTSGKKDLFSNICQNLSVKAIRIDRIWCFLCGKLFQLPNLHYCSNFISNSMLAR